MRNGIVLLSIVFVVASGALINYEDPLDEDEIPVHEEVLGETNPFSADTDGDGLSDSREKSIGTDPTDSDTDGDNLSDSREMELETDPLLADTDDDGLNDFTEHTGRTSPTDPDSDGDGLLDGWEVNEQKPGGVSLPDSDPLHRDIYLEAVLLGDTDLPDRKLQRIKEEFAQMPVTNPDGEDGIRVHVRGPRSVNVTETELRELDKLPYNESTRYSVPVGMLHIDYGVYNEEVMSGRNGTYRLLTVIPDSWRETDSRGFADGKVTVVQTEASTESSPSYRVMVHEILHTIVGRVGSQDCVDARHTCRGYLSYNPEQRFFSETTVEWLQNNAFYN